MTLPGRLWDRLFDLAERGRYTTSPNPRVGCLLVSPSGEVVGEGFHERAGLPHAEAMALAAAGEGARGATAYVNLEPCAHHGRTPPCADALAAAGVARVVFSVEDPDPRTAGAGAARLRAAGIEVTSGAEAARAELLNEPFLTAARRGRPYVHLRWGATLDGRLATRTGESRWITGEVARERSMRLREEHDAIVTGAGTVLADDPLLTRRLGLNASIVPHRRVVVDGRLRVPPTARLFAPDRAPGEVWLATARPLDDPAVSPFRDRGVRVVSIPGDGPGRVDLAALLDLLGDAGVRSAMVEAGGTTAWSFVAAGLVDRVTAFVAPLVVGGEEARPAVGGEGFADLTSALRLAALEAEPLGPDVALSGRVVR